MTDNPKGNARRGCFRISLTIFIIIVTAGAVFYFGWVQFKLDAGEFGVIYTKTNGWEDKIIENGKFEWRWQGLIPTNLTVHVFKPEIQTINLSRDGILPSGKMYAALLGGEEKFEWSFHATVKYILNPDTLPNLITAGNFNDNPESISESIPEYIYTDFEGQLQEHLDNLITFGSSKIESVQIKSEISRQLSAINENIIVKSIAITEFQYPDTDLYIQAKQLSDSYIAERKEILAEIEEVRLRREDVEDARIESLSKIGKVITEYPKLLELNPDLLEQYILGGPL